ncbi:hypothetical protein GCM10010442_54340 [Kitasatospora kifunensis]
MSAVLAFAMLAGLVSYTFAFAPRAAASVSGTRVATWNLQYSKDRFIDDSPRLMAEKGINLLALQEMLDRPVDKDDKGKPIPDIEKFSLPGKAGADLTWGADGNERIMNRSEAVYGGKAYYFYRVSSLNAKGGNTRWRGVGFISDASIADGDIDLVEPPLNSVVLEKPGYPFPLVGVKRNGTWYYSVHATNGENCNRNNTNGILATLKKYNTDKSRPNWAAMGDFNCPPSDGSFGSENGRLVIPAGVTIIKTDKETRKNRELDWMAASGDPAGYKATRMNTRAPLGSDHAMVVFHDPATTIDPDVADRPASCPLPAPRAGGVDSRAVPGQGSCRAAVQMGDSYISGEAGRWAGNANTSNKGSAWGTDRAARNCNGDESTCDHDLSAVYGDTGKKDLGDDTDACHRSTDALINQADIPGSPKNLRFNIACSGATTGSILSESFKGQNPQLEDLEEIAAFNDVGTVVVSIGGNDLQFSDIMTNCAKSFLSSGALNWFQYCKTSDGKAFGTNMDDVRQRVTATLAAIKELLDQTSGEGRYRIVLQSYVNPLPGAVDMRYPETYTRYSEGGCPFYDKDTDWAHNTIVPAISAMQRDAAAATGASFLDLKYAFAGHELCSKNAQQATSANASGSSRLSGENAEWIRWVPYLPDTPRDVFGAGRPNAQGNSQEAAHPNYFGIQKMASCLRDFLNAAGSTPVYQAACDSSPTPDSGVSKSSYVLRNAGNGEYLGVFPDDPQWAITWNKIDRSAGLTRWVLQSDPDIAGGWQLLNPPTKTMLSADLDGWATLRGDFGMSVRIVDSGKADGSVAFANSYGKCLGQNTGVFRKAHWATWEDCDTDKKNFANNQRWFLGLAPNTLETDVPPVDLASRTGHLDSAKDGLAADVDLASTSVGTRVKALGRKDHDAQTWIVHITPGGYQITSKLDGNRALGHKQGGDGVHEAQLVQADIHDKDQLWSAVDAGDGWVTIRNAERCLTAGNSDSTLTLDACDAGKSGQRWKVPGVTGEDRTPPQARSGVLKGLSDLCLGVNNPTGYEEPTRLVNCSKQHQWNLTPSMQVQGYNNKCLDVYHGSDATIEQGRRVQIWECNNSSAQEWLLNGRGELLNPKTNLCLSVPNNDTSRTLELWGCNNSAAQKWTLANADGQVTAGGDAGDPFDSATDDRGSKPATSGDCRPEGMTPTQGVNTPYCQVYDNTGREWVGNNRTRRVIGYFTGWRAGTDGDPKYLVSNIPWTKVTHINYAFASIVGNRISIGDDNDPKNPATGMTWPGDKNAMDPSLPYKGHFNLLNTYKKQHPAVKTLISVGGWADTKGFYAMTTTTDGKVNQEGIDAFAGSVVDFLAKYDFNGVDIDYEYPTALPSTGNPEDWEKESNPRRAGLQKGYAALMKTLREKLDKAGADRGRYYQLTSAGSSSGYLTRGLDAGQALQYQDFVNVMTYDLHGSWNKYVGPQAPLYDDGRDNELAAAGMYDAAKNPEYKKIGYFNTDWAYHYYRGMLPPGRINLGIPYYTRGWKDVQGGTDGLWGTAQMPDQTACPKGTGGRGAPSGAQECGMGAVGIDNVWHDVDKETKKVLGAGSNPLWHAKNLQEGITPGYLKSYGVDPASDEGRLTGRYEEKYSDQLQSPWLWNDAKKVFISTENEKSIDAKAKYIADKGIGGAMMWELAGDYTKRGNGEWGMGYDLTTRLDNALRGAGASTPQKAGGKDMPRQVLDVTAELVDFPTDLKDMWPLQPKLRITNNSKVDLVQGTEIAFDIPTSTSPLMKDGSWTKSVGTIKSGHDKDDNVGGLQGDFHRVTLKLGYCEGVPAGKSKDIDVKYYLPITGPSNITFKIGDKTFGSTGEQRRDVQVVDPPAPAGDSVCQAARWEPHAYNPNPSFAFWQTGDKWIIEDRNSGNVLDHPGSWTDAHLVEKQDNDNQKWTVKEEGAGWYHIISSTSGHDQCLGATTAHATLTVRNCDGKVDQWWSLVPLSTEKETENRPLIGQSVQGGPKQGTGYALGSFADTGSDWWKQQAYLAAPKDSSTSPGTKIIAGDTEGAWASTVSWNGYYWRTKWSNRGSDEPGKSEAWQKLSPTP